MKSILIVGATSGIGYEVARIYLERGYKVGLVGRRVEQLEGLAAQYPTRCIVGKVDVTSADAPVQVEAMIESLSGIDTLLYSSGIGWQNPELNPQLELQTVETNASGFVRVIDHVFTYFRRRGQGGHIAAITSIAGTKGLGLSPAYSATKRFQCHYIDALAQLSHREGAGIKFTDIRPGFVRTALLSGKNYPLQMEVTTTALLVVDAITRHKRVAIIDGRYRVLVFFWRLIPQWLWERIKL